MVFNQIGLKGRKGYILSKSVLGILFGTFALFTLQLYSLGDPIQPSLSLKELPLQILSIEETLQPFLLQQSALELLDTEDHTLRRVSVQEPRQRFEGSDSLLWNVSYPTHECKTEWFPENHWTDRDLRVDGDVGNGQQLFGTVAAQHAIWQHQHPSTCVDKKFLVYEALGPEHGIGSILHAMGVALQAALNLDRILVLYPQPAFEWTNGLFCQGTSTLDQCYFEPLSNCTVADAFGNMSVSLDSLWRFSELSLDSYNRYDSDWRFSEKILGSSVRTVAENFEDSKNIINVLRGETPHMFHSLLKAGNLSEKNFYWWRAQSVAYIVRPNHRTLFELKLRRNFYFNNKRLERGTISVHIPYGENRDPENQSPDKWISYLQSAEALVSRYPNLQRKIFLSTEDPLAISFFSKLTSWTVMWTKVKRVSGKNIITRPNQALGSFVSRFGWDEEFLNSLLNLQLALECDGSVGHLSSNWNRLIDELKSTVRCKHNRAYADIVQGFNISNYFW